MAVKYNLVQRGNPQKPDEPKKWYAQSKSDGDVSLKDLDTGISLPWIREYHCHGYGNITVMDTGISLSWIREYRCHGYGNIATELKNGKVINLKL
jgi:hypothetical protein